MPSKKKRKRELAKASTHPNNKYSENPPDFDKLASLYPSFSPYVFHTRDARPRIDWTDYNATRELTRVLLLHDHALNWWIPDGQLCPTVPNRSNYIHWIQDLLASHAIPSVTGTEGGVKGFDIGTGANCIYPLLGASLLGWSFVGSDVTDVALEWARKNVEINPHVSKLIEIRRVCYEEAEHGVESGNGESEIIGDMGSGDAEASQVRSEPVLGEVESAEKSYHGPPILVGVVNEGERFDFCMCNPPFFEAISEAGLNPKTACGGTPNEMVCPGGELAFITRMIQDSVQLQQSFRWYTSMVGRKSNLKYLIAKLWDVGVTIVKTTEFVQGRTSRWGLAWSFIPPKRNAVPFDMVKKTSLTFTLEGLQRQHSAFTVLQSANSLFCSCGASCKLDVNSFHLDVIAASDHCDVFLNSEAQNGNGTAVLKHKPESSTDFDCQENLLRLRISVINRFLTSFLKLYLGLGSYKSLLSY